MENIQTENLVLGKGAFVHPTAQIRGINGKAKKIVLGDHAYIGADVQIICDEFSLGDYSKMQHHCNVHGYLPCQIGHNAWIGQYTIIDSIGGTKIGNNCGIGAHSQLWSHIKYGDTLEGCRFLSEKSMDIGNDVWLVGHCIVSPITAEDKSMAMVGSVITRDMKYNRIYGGSPAQDLSEKIGFQFKEVSIAQKMEKMRFYLQESGISAQKIRIVETILDFQDDDCSYFAVDTRQYLKKGSEAEIAFMKYLLPDKAKFVPFNE